MIGSVLHCKPSFLLCRGSTNDSGSPKLSELTEQETKPPSDGVDKDDVPRLNVVGIFDK